MQRNSLWSKSTAAGPEHSVVSSSTLLAHMYFPVDSKDSNPQKDRKAGATGYRNLKATKTS
jgi:hypothetical protein